MIIIGSVKWWFNIGKWLQRSLESHFFIRLSMREQVSRKKAGGIVVSFRTF